MRLLFNIDVNETTFLAASILIFLLLIQHYLSVCFSTDTLLRDHTTNITQRIALGRR